MDFGVDYIKEQVEEIKDDLSEVKHTAIEKAQESQVAQKITKIVIALVILALVIFSAVMTLKYLHVQDRLISLLNKQHDTEITNVIVEEKLVEIGELATYSFEYSGERTEKDSRKLIATEWKIPFTENEVQVFYDGIIKVGYDVSDIGFDVNEAHKTIVFSIPDAKVLDNYIILDTLTFKEKNNILNPIGTKNIQDYLVDIEANELSRAKQQGIFEKAEEHLQDMIRNAFSEFSEYELIFSRK